MSEAIIQALRRRYMESVGNPARQLIGGGVRGYLGLDQPEYADQLGREAYANAQALGNAPGVGAPAGAFKAMAAAPLIVKALRKAPRDEALEVARQNAVKMLGLPENNTAMDRAKALGFAQDVYHGTPDDRLARSRQFKDEMLGKNTRVKDAAMGHYTTSSGKAGSEYTWRDGEMTGNVLPLMLRGKKETVRIPGEWAPGKFDDAIQRAKGSGADYLNIEGVTTLGTPGDYQVVFNPANIRSRFAAFDPARVNESDLLGRADPRLLGLIAAGTATGATVAALRNKKEDEKKKKRDE